MLRHFFTGSHTAKSKSHLKAKTFQQQTPNMRARPLYPCAAKVSSAGHTSAFMANFRLPDFVLPSPRCIKPQTEQWYWVNGVRGA